VTPTRGSDLSDLPAGTAVGSVIKIGSRCALAMVHPTLANPGSVTL